MKRIIAVLLCLPILGLCGCSLLKPKNAPDDGSDKISIVTTIFPLYDFARAVAGDRADITLLIDPACEVHSFDPTPSDIAAIYDCDLFLYIGGESDAWVGRVLADVNVNPIKMTDCVTLLGEDGHDEYDEHIWTSPENAISMLKEICDELCAISPENGEYFRANFDRYSGEIRAVQSDIRSVVDGVENPFILVADRFPFKYFTTEFGIEYKAAFGGCATSDDISLKVMGELVKTVEDRGCAAAFYTEMSGRTVANALAEQTGVALYELHSAHNVTADDFKAGVTYVDIMKRNLKALKKGLK